MIQPVEGKTNLVVKRDGRTEEYDPQKMRKVILWASNNSEHFTNALLDAINIKIHNRIKIDKLYDEVIATASNLISDLYPQWETIAKNLYLLKLHKDLGVKRTEYPPYDDIVSANVTYGYYDRSHPFLTDDNISILDKVINPDYDNLFSFGGLNLHVQKYCKKTKGRLLELPQHVYMRIAIHLMHKDGIQAVIDKYIQLATHSVTEATPKVVNSLMPNAALFSCCLVRPSDSQEGINESINMLTKESKYSGGCAWDASLIRAPGASVEGNKGSSSGVIPYIQGLQWLMSGYNQGNTRSSACIVTFDGFHYQSPELSLLKHESGKDEDRARKLQYSVKWRPEFSKAIKANEDIYLIDPHKTSDLFESYGSEWKELYDKYTKNPHIHKRKYNARELAHNFTVTTADTGNLYYFFPDNANEQDIGAGRIPASNLCVTGDTNILTNKGYFPIHTLANTKQTVWNGFEWSENVEILQTSEGQPVLEVTLSDFTTIKATPYHKWYIQQSYGPSNIVEKRTHELLPGDKIVKHELSPVIHGNFELPYSYENGFYSGDGTSLPSGTSRIYLYDDKRILLSRFSTPNNLRNYDRRLELEYTSGQLQPKFFIPSADYTVSSRLNWLAGIVDADGTLTTNNGTESIQLTSVNLDFLKAIRLMLQELGIHSTISLKSDSKYQSLPANDGTNSYKEYWCKAAYRLLIAGSQLNALLELGFAPSRVIPTRREYQRDARQFVTVSSVTDSGEIAPTYCATEPLRHTLVFNGTLTGNCQEMMMSYDPIVQTSATLSNSESHFTFSGDIALCNLASINLMAWTKLSSPEEKYKFMYLLVRSADNTIDNSFYINPLGKKHSENHRNLGIGTSNYANFLASNRVLWNSATARKLTHELYEELSFYAIKSSIQLAKEKSRCPVFNETKWAQGLFPHELSKLGKSDSHLNYPLLMDWESLRPDLLKYGIRNSRLLAIAPTATSGKVINATEGVDAPRRFKKIEEGTYSLPFVVPNLRENREYYQLMFSIANKDVIELAAIRQKFLCMGQSVSLAYESLTSAYEHVSNIILAEELGLKTIYYSYTKKASLDEGEEEEEEGCDSCGS